ncbi:MAG: hypothetical protein KC609_15625 [Myxococcales bacterium]|nr:hypothetical protein [Myxococcales bacterium]
MASEALEFYRRLHQISDSELRRKRLEEEIAPVHRRVQLFSEMIATVHSIAAVRESYLLFCEIAPTLVGDYDWVAETYGEAQRQGALELCVALLHPRAHRDITPDEVERDLNRLDDTLGERKTKARRSRGERLERLLLDPAPSVVELLLDNPGMSLAWTLRIASRRPNYAALLTLIMGHRRWVRLPDVQLSLARNPYMPTGLAMFLLPLLSGQTLREIEADGTLAPEVRDFALKLRSRGIVC